MRVLVTGATGFVGYAVAAALVDGGHEVTALTRSGRSLPIGTQRIGGDLLNVGSVEQDKAHTMNIEVVNAARLGRPERIKRDVDPPKAVLVKVRNGWWHGELDAWSHRDDGRWYGRVKLP